MQRIRSATHRYRTQTDQAIRETAIWLKTTSTTSIKVYEQPWNDVKILSIESLGRIVQILANHLRFN